MAKILTGPLAAGLSGKLGPVVFHQTRFGQTVQSKAKPRVYTTPAATATKRAFAAGARAYPLLGSGVNNLMNRCLRDLGKTPQGEFIACFSQAIRDGSAGVRIYIGDADFYTLGNIQAGGPTGYYIDAWITTVGNDTSQFVNWFPLEAGTYTPTARIASVAGPGADQVRPATTIAPPFVVISWSLAIAPVGDPLPPRAMCIGPARALLS